MREETDTAQIAEEPYMLFYSHEEPQVPLEPLYKRAGSKIRSIFGGGSHRIRLALMLVALIFSRSVDQVLFYRISFTFQYYIFYFSSVILPVAFLMITAPVVVYKVFFTNHITPDMRRFPQWKFAILGLLDAVFNILSTFPVQHLGGSMANILSQTVLPFNMFLSFAVLGTRFKQVHYLGAVLVIYGVLVKLMPDIFDDGASQGSNIGWMLLLMGANVFSAGSNVFKERALKGCDMDEWWMNLWVSMWQLVWGVACFWQGYVGAFMDPMPPIGNCDDCTWSKYVVDANVCFFGGKVDIVGLRNSTCASNVSDPIFDSGSGLCTLDCSAGGNAPIFIFLAYIIFNISYNFLMLAVFKEGSSVLFVIANAIRLPLVDLLLMWQWLSGPAFTVFSHYDGYALFALCLGTLAYYSEDELKRHPKATDVVFLSEADAVSPEGQGSLTPSNTASAETGIIEQLISQRRRSTSNACLARFAEPV